MRRKQNKLSATGIVTRMLRRVIASGLVLAGIQHSSLPAQTNGVLREVYEGIAGTTIPDLTNSPAYPNSPTSTNYVTDFFEAPINAADYYGQRIRGFVIPPQTGNYVFWISSDDDGSLYLSTDESPANKQLIAYVAGWTNPREWSKFGSQQSAAIPLTAGQRYYVEALMKEGGGGDNLAVRWQLPNATIEEPIPASRLLPWGTSFTPPIIAQQPTNTTAIEGQPATFTVRVSNLDLTFYQWRRSGTNLPGANSSAYTIPAVALTDNGAPFSCFLTNSLGSTNSTTATLFVTPDTNAPTLFSAQNVGSTNVKVIFSEPVAVATATTATNYSLNNGATISAAAFGSDTRTILLTTSPLIFGSNYTLKVSNVKDRAATPNTIATNSTIAFVASEFAPQDVGNPALAGSQTRLPNGFAVSGGGSDIGGTADQMQFSYQLRTGNFDVKARIESLDLANLWAKAGLVAREDLTAGSRFAGALATPSLSGCFFQSRDPAGGNASLTGSFPVNYPATWLRLQRVGNQFTGYASYDGQVWTQLGTVNIAMAGTVYFGLAASSHNTGQLATAQFRDVADVSGAVVGTPSVNFETLGPSSRKTGLVISEIMYHPTNRLDGKNLEFIELFNSNPFYEDISGLRISGEVDFTFPANTIMPGGSFLVIAKVPADVESVYGIANVMGPYTNSLASSGTIRLRSQIEAIYLEIPYNNNPPWPVAADGAGHSLVLARPSYGEANPRAWDISDQVGGSPGGYDGYRPSPLRSVVINEFLAHTDPPLLDYIELYNHANQAVDIGGCVLTDDPATNRFVIPSPTVIPARGFVSFTETTLGFRLDAVGETIYFINTNSTRVLDCVQFEGQENSVSMGRWPDGASEFYPLQTRTPATGNSSIKIRDIVINEIMYHPISGNDNDQYVELYNKGDSAINVSGWRFVSGIDYTLPTNTVIAANGYLVVAKSVTNLLAHYGNLNTNNTLGNFDGKLAGSGERLALAMWDEVVNTNTPGVTTTNIAWIVVDEVTYQDGGRWGQWADGGGSSLELIDPRGNHRLAYNWEDSDETAKGTWTNIEATGTLDNGANYGGGSINRLQLGMLGAGECLIDEVEVRPGGAGANIVSNPGFESGTTSWSFQGDHVRSNIDPAGAYAGINCLHIRASDQMWTGANSVEGNLTSTLTSGQTATLRFKARWLHGWPEALVRLNGNWLEAAGKMSIPTNLGTPGLVNSSKVPNAGPAIYEVAHSPSIPAANQAVVVTARVHDPDAPVTLQLKYRVDPSASYSTATMTDNGAGGDAIASDGIYSATIPAQAGGTVVAFYVQANDSSSVLTRFPTDLINGAPVRECVVYFGDTVAASGFGSYHLWLTQANIDRWSNLPDLSNEPHDGTWVYGNRIIYNMVSTFSGSPYHQQFDSPIGSPCHYSCDMPADDKLFGTTSFNKIHAPGNGPFDDNTIQREQTAYWMVRQLGVPWNYRRYIAMYVNGNRRGTLMEDSQVPNGDVIEEYFPNDSDGQLFKLQPWFEFDANGSGFDNMSWCTLNNYTTTGGAKKVARYRWNYMSRKNQTTASDYTNVFNLVNAAATYGSTNYVANMENLVDMEEWLRIFAIEHAVGNWDSFGAQNSQNMYGYKPENGKWNLLIWDYNIVLGNSGSWGPDGNNLFTYNGADAPMGQIYANPTFRRTYLRAFKEIANGPMLNANVDPVMDAKFAAFSADGVGVASPSGVKSWIATMRNSLLSTLNNEGANAAFAITSNSGNNFSTNKNFLTLSGTAPVEVKTITINGLAWPVRWNSVTGWTLTLALTGGVNVINLVGLDYYGNVVGGATDSITINYTGTAELPQDKLVINEIMYNAALPKAAFIELYNTSTNNAFDLSGWRLDGADFTFPGSSIILPNSFMVVAGDAEGFVTAYGSSIPLAGIFNGTLQDNGETLKLVKPGIPDTVIDEVTYDSVPPWPTAANGFGPSLQLLDPAQDNNRVMNWAVSTTNGPAPQPQWQFASVTGTAGTATFYTYLNGLGDVYVDDIQLVAGPTAGVGPNLMQNGDFESTLTGPWTVSANFAGSAISSTVKHSGNGSLHLVATAAGSGSGNSISESTLALTSGGQYTLSYWYLPNTNGGILTLRLSTGSGGNLRSDQNILFQGATSTQYTPGATNSVRTNLAAFPLVWLNEVQPNNITGLQDNFGDRDPWVELYNSGTNSVDLSTYYLSDNYTNLLRWPFPGSTTITQGQYRLVWLDNEPGETSGVNLHASFRASSTNGSVILTKVSGSVTSIVDYLNYSPINNDRSFGAFPNGTPTKRQVFYFATPGGTNNSTWPAVPITINEWMASNTGTLVDSADGHYDDWFELHNAGPTPVNLAGYTLTDNLTNKTQFVIPSGYSVPANGYLLVWADNDSSQNSTNDPRLHANFALSKGGEAIGLYAPDLSPVDTVTFGAQTNDVSQGRWPDGNSGSYYFMTTATPGLANVLGNVTNQPPVLGFIPDKTVYQGSPLSFTATATDPDSGQTKTFSLDPGAPATAFINPSSGVFNWTPSASDFAGDHFLTVRVTDNGTPPLSDTQIIKITVLTPPVLQLTSILHNGNGSLTFSWATQPQRTYRILYKTNLTQAVWNTLADVPSTGITLSLTDDTTTDQQRYYRIQLLP